MQNAKFTTSRCLLTLMLVVTIFILISFQVPQLTFIPALITKGVSLNSSTLTLVSFSEVLITAPSTTTQVTSTVYLTTVPSTTTQVTTTEKKIFSKTEESPENEGAILKDIARKNKVKDLDCQALYHDSESEKLRAKQVVTNVTSPIDDLTYISLTADCRTFVVQRGYILSSLTKEEEDFPLAFSILVFKEAEMVERLLKAIYRPQNYYCIHVDKKSSETFYAAISGIAKCFPNVFLTSRRIDVQWGWFSVLEPELQCMEELWRYPKWKYFFTLTGQEFPLKTNYELVKILTTYGGANDVEGTVKRANKERFRTPPPLGIRAVKGSVHITVNRDFIDYILHNNTAKLLLEWAQKNTSVPDETYFATLNHNPQLGIKGTYKDDPETDWSTKKPFLTRFKNWGTFKCAGGTYVRAICILTLGDLPMMGEAKHYFANKFYLSQDRVVIGCLEEKIFNDTRDEYLGLKTFNTSYYASLGFVINKV